MNKLFFIIAVLLFDSIIFSQEDNTNPIDIYVVDSFITQETPHTLILSFFTSDSANSKIVIDNKYNYPVSEVLTDNHKISIDLSKLTIDSNYIRYIIIVKDKEGKESKSDMYEVAMPFTGEIKSSSKSNMFEVCCFGGIIFGLPEPTLVYNNKETFFALKKEIPLFSFYSGGYNYPMSYFDVEYEYVFKQKFNFLRFGYKHIIQIPVIEYISPGINGFTNFNGGNGISPELSIGLFRIYNVFTLNVKYRYNIKFSDSKFNFHECSIGLYSNFFSINF
ncbi:MAG: hypothetical protein V1773_10980 [bacterium]